MPEPSSEQRLRSWLLRHHDRLAERAIDAIDGTEALHGALQPYVNARGRIQTDVSATQLSQLRNTARVCEAADVVRFVRERARRRKRDEKEREAAFWEGTARVIEALRSDVTDALADTGHAATAEEQHRMYTLIARVFLEHYVAHGQYLQVEPTNEEA